MTNDDDPVTLRVLKKTLAKLGPALRTTIEDLIGSRMGAVEDRIAALAMLGSGAEAKDLEAVEKLMASHRTLAAQFAAQAKQIGVLEKQVNADISAALVSVREVQLSMAEGLQRIDATLNRAVKPIYGADGKLLGAQRVDSL